MVRRKKRMKELKEHPLWALRFDPADWDGSPEDAMVLWRNDFRKYWEGQEAAGDVVLPVGVVQKSREAHIFWKIARMGEARRLVRGEPSPLHLFSGH